VEEVLKFHHLFFVVLSSFPVNYEINHNTSEKADVYAYKLQDLSHHKEVLVLEEVLVLVHENLLEWIVWVKLLRGVVLVFQGLEDLAKDGVYNDCGGL
jgi:hypothetical protein